LTLLCCDAVHASLFLGNTELQNKSVSLSERND